MPIPTSSSLDVRAPLGRALACWCAETFHGELARLGQQLADMCRMAAESMRQASRALLTADLQLAERVLTADVELDGARRSCEDHAQSLLALQAPVAGDLRTILATVYGAEKIERMGDLAAHIADTARFTHPEHAVPRNSGMSSPSWVRSRQVWPTGAAS